MVLPSRAALLSARACRWTDKFGRQYYCLRLNRKNMLKTKPEEHTMPKYVKQLLIRRIEQANIQTNRQKHQTNNRCKDILIRQICKTSMQTCFLEEEPLDSELVRSAARFLGVTGGICLLISASFWISKRSRSWPIFSVTSVLYDKHIHIQNKQHNYKTTSSDILFVFVQT